MKKRNYLEPEIQVVTLSLGDVLGLSTTTFDDTFIDEESIVG